MNKTFYQRHRKGFDVISGLFLGNTILERGLVLAPVVVASYNYKNSLILGLSFMIITFLTVILSSFIPKKIPYTVRTILYMLVACCVFVPTAVLMDNMFPETIFRIGVFLPLIVANSLIVVKSESRFHKRKKSVMIIDILCHCIGFFVVIVTIGLLREFFGEASFMSIPVKGMFKVPAIQLPFCGFIILGFMASIVKFVQNKLDTATPKHIHTNKNR